MKGKKLNKIITVLLVAFLIIPSYNVLAAKKYKVTLNNDGGTGGLSEVTNVKNGSAMPKLSKVPKKDGLSFGGYYSNTKCLGTKYYNANGTSAKKYDKKSDTTLYACWILDNDAVTPGGSAPSGGSDFDSYYNGLSGYEHTSGKKDETFSKYENYDFVKGRLKFTNPTRIEGDATNTADPLTGGYGIFVKLIQYDSNSKEEKVVGKPILVYSGNLFGNIVTRHAAGGSEVVSSGASKICLGLSCTPEFCQEHNLVPVSVPTTLLSSLVSRLTYDSQLSHPTLDVLGLFGDPLRLVFDTTELVDLDENLFNVACVKTGQKHLFERMYHYDGDDVLYETGNPDVSTPTIKRSSKNLKGINLYDYVINCLSSNSCEFGLTAPLTKDKLETAFNCKNCINERMLDSYYLSFEPVVREKTSTPNSSKYAQNVKESVSNKGIEQWNYTCTYSPCNSSGHSPNNYFKQSGNKSDIGYCTKYKHVEQKYSCGDCDSTHTTKCKSGVTCKHYYTETTYDCNSSDNDGSEPQLWRATGCYSYRIEMHTYLSTVHTYYYSVIKPARTTSTGNGMLDDLVTAENRGENSLTLHINEETGAEEHYIGPDLENAITGQCGKLGRNPSSKCKSQNKYSLYFSGIKNEDGSNFEFKKGNAGKSAIGVLYLWFPEITGCNTVCENTTGETRYQCAENYCDSLYYYEEGSTSATQKRKAGCLISCGVQYNPNNCLSKINDINFIKDIMGETPNSILSGTSYAFNSSCNNNLGDGASDNDKGYTRYCLMDTTDTDILDQMQFVNVMCVESTSCGFLDLSSERLTKGRRIDFNSRAHVKKKCKVWFDIDSWKFYYASVPFGDIFGLPERGSNGRTVINTYYTRDRMLAMIDWYNNAARRGFDESIAQNIVKEGSTVTWEKLDYDISKFNMRTTINENYIGDPGHKTEQYNLVENKQSVDSELNNVTNSTSLEDAKPNSDSSKIRTNAYSYSRYTRIEKKTNTYMSSSSYDATYELPTMYCISEDREATPVSTPNETCPDGTLAVHSYFLNLHTTGVDFTTYCSNERTVGTNVKYFESQDDCPPSTENASCQIVVKGDYQCGQYTGPVNIKMYMTINNTVDVKLQEYSLKVGNTTYNSDKVDNFNPNPGGTYDIYGTVKLTDGTVTHCQDSITVNECTMNGCKIERDYSYTGSGRDRYFIIDRSGDTSGAFYAKTTNSSSGFLKLGKEENNRHVFYPIPPNDGTTGRLSSDYDIIGKIVRGNTCKVCCEKPVTPPGSCNQDLKAVKEYCDESYDEDPHQFKSKEVCIAYYNSSCCPTYSEAAGDYARLEQWCSDENNLRDNQFASSAACMNKCCQDQEKCVVSDNITYRPVSRENPFPNSVISAENGYPDGDRLVGRNWIGFQNNIIDTESGANSVYDEVEYEIILNREEITNIRDEIKENSSIYYDYIDARDEATKDRDVTEGDVAVGGCNTGNYKGYCSNFVHRSGYFNVVRGDKKKTTTFYNKQ